MSALKIELHNIWFKEYSRAKGVVGSSGFEHVFVGELDRDKMVISGSHNWVNTLLQENSGSMNYQGYIRYDPQVWSPFFILNS